MNMADRAISKRKQFKSLGSEDSTKIEATTIDINGQSTQFIAKTEVAVDKGILSIPAISCLDEADSKKFKGRKT